MKHEQLVLDSLLTAVDAERRLLGKTCANCAKKTRVPWGKRTIWCPLHPEGFVPNAGHSCAKFEEAPEAVEVYGPAGRPK